MQQASSLSVRVYYEDTDAAGVVYHANYLKFMERGRTEWLNALNLPLDKIVEQYSIVFAARRMDIDFIKPAHLNNALSVHTQLKACRHASLVFLQEIYRQTTTICRATVKIACLDKTKLSPTAIPKALLNQFKPATEGVAP